MTRSLVLLCLLSAADAADEYDTMLEEARRIVTWPDEALTMEQRLNLQYDRLAQAALKEPSRWEAYFERGVNRCKRAFFAHGEAEAFLAGARARGADEEALARIRQAAAEQIGRWIAEAHHDFQAMEGAMRRRGGVRPDHILFANAAMKFAGREYEKASGGHHGAIEDFKELVRRGFLADLCADHIALCHLDIGYAAYVKEEYEVAQRSWDEGLRWARQPALRQILLTNKAGGYEMDNEYALAEKILREQIAKEPERPSHHKNLGLVLGYQNRLKEALYCYERARELCRRTPDMSLALLHGNAWIRAAVIHGKLLEREGDVLLAWRLFCEYRAMFGDDYNFSLWFGDFAATHRQYDLAWLYLEHARDQQPHCTAPYQMLTQIAPRTGGSGEEVTARIETTKQAYLEAQSRYLTAEETPAVKRICGGLGDIGDIGRPAHRMPLLDPDPLGGFDAAHPPPWILKAAEEREPFVPWTPPPEPAGTAAPETASPDAARERGYLPYAVAGAALAACGALLYLRRRRRAA